MREMPLRVGLLALCLSAVLGLTGCSVSLFPFSAHKTPTPQPTATSLSTAQLADQAVAAWGQNAAEHFKGTLSTSGITLSVDVTLAFGSSGDALGSGTANKAPFQYLSTGDQAYIKGQSFWQGYFTGQAQQQLLAKGYQDNYTIATGNNVALAIQQLTRLGGAVQRLSSEDTSVRRGGGVLTVGGQMAVGLTDGTTTWWVTQGPKVQLVGLKSQSQGGLQNVDLLFQQAQAPTGLSGQLGSPVDPDDPSTMPALYEVTNVMQQNKNNCNDVVCGFNVTVVNQEGKAAGQGVVTVSTYANQSSTQVLADCTANIPTTLATNQSVVVNCGVSGPGWQAYAGTNFYVKAIVTQNPPYV